MKKRTKAKPREPNWVLLAKTASKVLERPDQVNMSVFFSSRNGVCQEAGGCGTAGCIAGWGMHLASNHKTINQTMLAAPNWRDGYEARARRVFRITHLQANRLFYIPYWPKELYKQYTECARSRSAPTLAAVVARRILLFIETKGKQ